MALTSMPTAGAQLPSNAFISLFGKPDPSLTALSKSGFSIQGSKLMPLPSDNAVFDNCRCQMSQFLSVFITVPSREVAEKIGRTIVEERLAACVNIIPEMRSIYRWHDNLESATEAVLIAKSRTALFALLEQRVKALHPYDCPCIVAWPIETGHQPYLDWIAQNTGS